MDLIDKLRGKKQKEYTIDQAAVIMRKNMEISRKEGSDALYRNALKVHWELQHLSTLITEFKDSRTPEGARSSENVKDRFCSIATSQISSIGKPLHDNALNYISSTRALLDNLGGLTHRQLLHINFFFKDSFNPVAKKINEIHALTVAQGEDINAKAIAAYESSKHHKQKLRSLVAGLESGEFKLKQIESTELPRLAAKPDRAGLDNAETKVKNIKQGIDSFLSIGKVLKKYIYVENIKTQLLQEYIESPSNALLKDNDIEISNHARMAADRIRSGKIDEPRDKIEFVASAAGWLRSKRAELIGAIKVLNEEVKNYSRENEEFERSIKERTNKMSHIETETKNLKKFVESTRHEITATEKDVAIAEQEFKNLASSILKAHIS